MTEPDNLIAYLTQAGGAVSEAGFEAFKHARGLAPQTHGRDPHIDPMSQVPALRSADGSPLTARNQGDTEAARNAALGARQERETRERIETQRRQNEARRASGEAAELDDFQRAQASAARQREVEATRQARALLDKAQPALSADAPAKPKARR